MLSCGDGGGEPYQVVDVAGKTGGVLLNNCYLWEVVRVVERGGGRACIKSYVVGVSSCWVYSRACVMCITRWQLVVLCSGRDDASVLAAWILQTNFVKMDRTLHTSCDMMLLR